MEMFTLVSNLQFLKKQETGTAGADNVFEGTRPCMRAEEEGQEPLPKDVKRTHETHCGFAKWCSVMGKQGNE
jgi:hypothetical protein